MPNWEVFTQNGVESQPNAYIRIGDGGTLAILDEDYNLVCVYSPFQWKKVTRID